MSMSLRPPPPPSTWLRPRAAFGAVLEGDPAEWVQRPPQAPGSGPVRPLELCLEEDWRNWCSGWVGGPTLPKIPPSGAGKVGVCTYGTFF